MSSTLRRSSTVPITYWPPKGSDGFGGVVYGPPKVIRGHYEETLVRINVAGMDVESDAMACIDTDVMVGGLLLVGVHIAGTDAERALARKRARQIVKFSKTPSVRGNSYDRVVYM